MVILERVREGESFEEAYRRFKRECEKEQLFAEIRRHEHYEKPSQKKRILKARAQRR